MIYWARIALMEEVSVVACMRHRRPLSLILYSVFFIWTAEVNILKKTYQNFL